jgi:ankyrin repeat domain-containing protein 50
LRVGVASVFCDYNNTKEQTPAELLYSIVRQLLVKSSNLTDLRTVFTSGKSRPNDLKIIEASMHTVMAAYARVYVVVDALDECPETENSRDTFVSKLRSSMIHSKHLHILITSRRNILPTALGFTESDYSCIDISAHDDDLKTYITGRLRTEYRLKRVIHGDTVFEENIGAQVMEMASKM